jgi:hypothetical protein
VKIASLSPQFIFEPPAGERDAEAEKSVSELGLKVVRTEAASAAAEGDRLDSETRDGLKRLSQLIRKKTKPSPEKERGSGDQKKRRALRLYQYLSEAKDPREGRGENVDEYV